MKTKGLFLIALLFSVFFVQAQTKEELLKEKASKQDSINVIQKRVDAIQGKIDALPGWRFKTFGTIGGSMSGFNNWYAKETPNSSVGNFGINVNVLADLVEEKYFWKNAMNVNVSWVKFDNKDDDSDNSKYEVATDIFSLTSLYGYNLSKNFAASAFMEFRTSLVQNFADPGFLDLGIGATWTPIKDLVVVIHPLNYNIILSRGNSVFDSTFGTKIMADYTKKLGDFNIRSNLSVFQSYKGSNYSNFTWTNSFAYNIWKNVGVGFDFGLRKNKQEALNFVLETDPGATFDTIDNELQSYWLFGVTYTIE